MLLATKVKNEIHKLNCTLECNIKNISVNGEKRGCSGFITNPKTGACVYINTEGTCCGPTSQQVMWRKAKDIHDYTGEQNHWCNSAVLVKTVVKAVSENA